MGTPNTFDKGMSCHSTGIELFYFTDDFHRMVLWVLAFTDGAPCVSGKAPTSAVIRPADTAFPANRLIGDNPGQVLFEVGEDKREGRGEVSLKGGGAGGAGGQGGGGLGGLEGWGGGCVGGGERCSLTVCVLFMFADDWPRRSPS